MERILTQEEIAELLSAVRKGDVDDDLPAGKTIDTSAASVTRIDLLTTHAKGQIRINNLDLIIDSFARNFSNSLTNRVQQPLTIKRDRIESMECDAFLQNLTHGIAIGIYRFEPMRAACLLVFDDNLAFALIEILLGGSTELRRRQIQRPLTAIELNILRTPLKDACSDMVKAFGDLDGVSVDMVNVQNNPRLVNVIPHEALIAVADFDVKIGSCQGQIHLVLPTGILNPLREKLQSSRDALRASNDIWPKHLRKGLESIPVGISAELGKITLEMRDFINFQIGDIIDLPWAPSDQLSVFVEGHPKYRGQAGVRNGNKAIRVTGTFQEDTHAS